ncbi:MAG TPA: glycine cleavage system aminomethyltransferase GcvT [Bryobacteraceae bacterium]|nr:glycine cleavage system aminomethyltransferase GcvT [Bryobacteraceae bacterium]
MTASVAPLKRTPLNAVHRGMGARMVDFEGWDMPVEYAGVIPEHRAVRHAVGLFDVSHMGEILISGPQALDLTQHVTTNDASKLRLGQAQYSSMLYAHGGFVDDILVHRVSDHVYFLCVNAANQSKDFDHILGVAREKRFDAMVEDAGPRYAQLAIQGPRATDALRKLTASDLAAVKRYRFTDGRVSGAAAHIARTGYTGEDGWEIYIAPEEAERLWREILEAGRAEGIVPCGLGARNTLRMEAGMPLYGHEIHASLTPWEAGLDWIVKLEKGDFLGRDALVKQKETGIRRKLIGFEVRGREIARDGYEVFVNGVAAGWVTSGGPAPALNKNIGMCYLPLRDAGPGRAIEVMVRGRAVEAVTVPLPFYKRAR